ncbi:peptidylprolyl isomerase SurA [Neiella marina]|uniref:Chaperone SurA n=2 Tax=Neiella holothuriorum TaxID=2870530 RepID=A0ABS7EIY4_9GAMM|nr:peptidylprolyl isomerase SurA [Neiella holothuriorum]MBW8192309.1 peptidylprolyl isomerase SurA [Neiella holothuriorum]
MKRITLSAIKALAVALALQSSAIAEPQLIDRVVVRVNNSVVLESEVQRMLEDVKARALDAGQTLPRDSVLRTQITERLVDRKLQLSMADRMGLRISDAQLDQTITSVAAQEGMTIEQMRAEIESGGSSYQLYREEIRDELVIGDVTRMAVRNRINVSPQEVEGLAKMLEEQSQNNREMHFGHIMVIADTDSSKQEIEDAEARINKILSLLKEEGSDFRRQATTSSQGPKALEGGDWGWMNINEVPTIFADSLRNADKGDLLGPVRSPVGFHLIKVFDVRGVEAVELEEIHSRHILLKPSIIMSEAKARSMLQSFVKELRQDDSKFAELAEEYSEDPGSAANGGDLGWANPAMYVPEFSAQLGALEKNQISEPFRTTHGWHIVQLLDKRILDASEQRWADRAYQMIAKRKFTEESATWLREMRESAYIDVIDE